MKQKGGKSFMSFQQQTHVIELEIKRFYKVYVEDETNSMTAHEIHHKARQMALESEENLTLDSEIDIEEHDILDSYYQYDIEDGDSECDEKEVR